MNHVVIFGIALGLSVLSGLAFMAGAPGFSLLPREQANFAGIALGAVGAVFWILWAVKRPGG